MFIRVTFLFTDSVFANNAIIGQFGGAGSAKRAKATILSQPNGRIRTEGGIDYWIQNGGPLPPVVPGLPPVPVPLPPLPECSGQGDPCDPLLNGADCCGDGTCERAFRGNWHCEN